MSRDEVTKALAALDPDDFDFHAARWDSAEHFQAAIRQAQEGTFPNIELALADEATLQDGGDPGQIPCVPDHVLSLFWDALEHVV